MVFGIAARLSAVKDVATLIRGFGLACERTQHIRLVIAGDGEQREMLENLARQCCPRRYLRVRRLGGGHRQLLQCHRHQHPDVPLRDLPLCPDRGARMHCATIASRVGGVPLLIQDGVCGLLFEPQNFEQLAKHMAAMAEDDALRHRLGEALYRRASEHFSVDATVSRQREIYRILLRRAARPQGPPGRRADLRRLRQGQRRRRQHSRGHFAADARHRSRRARLCPLPQPQGDAASLPRGGHPHL